MKISERIVLEKGDGTITLVDPENGAIEMSYQEAARFVAGLNWWAFTEPALKRELRLVTETDQAKRRAYAETLINRAEADQ